MVFTWGFDTLFLTNKFWTVWRKEGFIRAWHRGRMTAKYRAPLDNTGWRSAVKCVGEDQFGNKYYEDIHDTNGGWQSYRWVELADIHNWFETSRKIPPEWHGWISRTTDDIPKPGNTAFYKPVYKKWFRPPNEGIGPKPNAYEPHGRVLNNNRETFYAWNKAKVYQKWQPPQ